MKKQQRRKHSLASQPSNKPVRIQNIPSSTHKIRQPQNYNSVNQISLKSAYTFKPIQKQHLQLEKHFSRKNQAKGQFTKILQESGGRTVLRDQSSKRIKATRRPVDTPIQQQDFQCDEQIQTIANLITQPIAIQTSKMHSHRLIDKGIQTLLRRFGQQINNYSQQQQKQKFINLIKKQDLYMADPYYLGRRQQHLTWSMRAILIDWMMHVLKQYRCKRDTFHLAVSLVDRYLSKSNLIQIKQFQLIGATCMYIASKLQEILPSPVSKFAESTARQYTGHDITRLQLRILYTLGWQLHAPTISMWANRLLSQWDQYILSRHQVSKMLIKPTFKQQDQNSYRNFRQMMQLLDCSVMDSQSLQYKPRALVASFLYLMVGKLLGAFTQRMIVKIIPNTSKYLFRQQNAVNSLFDCFLQLAFGLGLADLHPTVQFCSGFFQLPLTFDSPIQGDQETISYQDFCSFQSYNPNCKNALKSRRSSQFE